jgi:hypothetical protein
MALYLELLSQGPNGKAASTQRRQRAWSPVKPQMLVHPHFGKVGM